MRVVRQVVPSACLAVGHPHLKWMRLEESESSVVMARKETFRDERPYVGWTETRREWRLGEFP
jgi:hypothetical protein